MRPSWPPRGECGLQEDFPPPPISSGPNNGVAAAAFAKWEKEHERRRAYREKNRERILATQRASAARKREVRSHYCCLLRHSRLLTINLPAVATDKPHF